VLLRRVSSYNKTFRIADVTRGVFAASRFLPVSLSDLVYEGCDWLFAVEALCHVERNVKRNKFQNWVESHPVASRNVRTAAGTQRRTMPLHCLLDHSQTSCPGQTTDKPNNSIRLELSTCQLFITARFSMYYSPSVRGLLHRDGSFGVYKGRCL
jgi:hypothetical protein